MGTRLGTAPTHSVPPKKWLVLVCKTLPASSFKQRSALPSTRVTATMVMKPNCPETIAQLDKENDANQNHPLVFTVARYLQATVDQNERNFRETGQKLKDFEAAEAPPITAAEYVKRLMKYGGISPSCLVIALMYLERMKPQVGEVWLTSRNVQRLFLLGVMEASKFWEDFYYANKRWAEIGAITLAELNKLEVQFLTYTKFDLQVTTEQYMQFASVLSTRQPTGSISDGMVLGRNSAVGTPQHATLGKTMVRSNSNPDFASHPEMTKQKIPQRMVRSTSNPETGVFPEELLRTSSEPEVVNVSCFSFKAVLKSKKSKFFGRTRSGSMIGGHSMLL